MPCRPWGSPPRSSTARSPRPSSGSGWRRWQRGGWIWFTSPRGKRVALWSILATAPFTAFLILLNAHVGVRRFLPEAPQALADLWNPATLLLVGIAACSVLVGWRTGSRRMAAITLFSCFLSAYVLLMIIGTFFRGPNWDWIWPWN